MESSIVERFLPWIGLAIMVVSETATLLHIEPFWSWNTPIAWTGFIIFADSIVYRARGDSWIRSAPGEFALLALASIPLWLVFEWFNLYIRNWHYTGLPENFWLRHFGYAWSFATISPAIFEGAELFAVLRAGRAGQAGGAGQAGQAGQAGWEGRDGHDGLADPAHPFSSRHRLRATWRRPSGSGSSSCSIRSTRGSVGSRCSPSGALADSTARSISR
ncbi:MAG: hypothetical protein AUH43_13845 [Acidobacteria bacterium 13_1_40CM_65_14]|nr:MAG: hypothetical protein AUH43_13845 [Acidobacteria bacterium 13_1_40CM_65_14]